MLSININLHLRFFINIFIFSALFFTRTKFRANHLYISELPQIKPFEISKFNLFQGNYREFLTDLL